MATDLKEQLRNALTAFNDAQGKSYEGLSEYLADRLTVHRVDDLTPIQGRKSDVLTIFHDSAKGCLDCPVFKFDPSDLKVSSIDSNVVTVLKGDYYDTQADYKGNKPKHIACSYHFTGGLIDRVLPVHL